MHQCVKCGTVVDSSLILKGCPECGGTFFKYKKEDIVNGPVLDDGSVQGSDGSGDEKKDSKKKTSRADDEGNLNSEDIESVMVKQHGVYEINLNHLLDDGSFVVSDNEGQYAIDLNSILKKKKRDKKKKDKNDD